MNHEQWAALQAATSGHKGNPLGDCDQEGLACVVFCAGWTDADVALAAAAPDLLAEVERLRGWMAHVYKNTPWDIATRDMCQDALNGAEVPK